MGILLTLTHETTGDTLNAEVSAGRDGPVVRALTITAGNGSGLSSGLHRIDVSALTAALGPFVTPDAVPDKRAEAKSEVKAAVKTAARPKATKTAPKGNDNGRVYRKMPEDFGSVLRQTSDIGGLRDHYPGIPDHTLRAWMKTIKRKEQQPQPVEA